MLKAYRLSAATGLHRGDRAHQQDQVALYVHPRVNGCVLAVVADGMGGRTGGRKAADQVLLTARQLFERHAPETDDGMALLRQIGSEAHMVIRLTAISAEQEPHSTMAAFLIHPDGECHWAHTGDSRLYHFRGARLMCRTLDQSYVQSLVDKGEISPEDAAAHPQSNVLMGCLGTEEDPTLDMHRIAQLQIGDALLACSDGVWKYFRAEELGAILQSMPAREASEFIVASARERARGAGDNLALAIVKVGRLASGKSA